MTMSRVSCLVQYPNGKGSARDFSTAFVETKYIRKGVHCDPLLLLKLRQFGLVVLDERAQKGVGRLLEITLAASHFHSYNE